MPNPTRTDIIRLQHMMDAAREALEFVRGKTRADLDQKRQLVLSLIKSIEIIGEAASQVSASCRKQSKQIPWQRIIGMRHRLVHGYFSIDATIVWNTIVHELPALVAQLQALVP